MKRIKLKLKSINLIRRTYEIFMRTRNFFLKAAHAIRLPMQIKYLGFSKNLFVLNGPFKGMQYIKSSTGSQLLPKIIGSYEEPIFDILSQIQHENYSEIIDVGCAEGYYAVGLKMMFPDVRVVACDINQVARNSCADLASLNGVRLEIVNSITGDDLLNYCEKRMLLFVDIEGSEIELLTQNLAKKIVKADIICEVHDFLKPDIGSNLIKRFSDTHTISQIDDYEGRKLKYYDYLGDEIPRLRLRNMVNERRPTGMYWLFMKAKYNV
jgi:hypothetical protein